MRNLIKSILVQGGYGAVARGMRMPRAKVFADLRQWGRLMDLIKALEINVFLDVGANKGFFSKHLRMSGYRGRLLSFEPILEDYRRIEILAKGDADWIVSDLALGAENGSRDFKVIISDGETVLSSFLQLKGQPAFRSFSAKIRRLDCILGDMMGDIKNPRIFLKMDTQGFDSEVFAGASGWMDRIFGIQSELSVIPLYDGMPHYTDSLNRYEASGFKLMDLFVVNRMPNSAILEYDCLMAR
jgi:FkbM family methyltransferase